MPSWRKTTRKKRLASLYQKGVLSNLDDHYKVLHVKSDRLGGEREKIGQSLILPGILGMTVERKAGSRDQEKGNQNFQAFFDRGILILDKEVVRIPRLVSAVRRYGGRENEREIWFLGGEKTLCRRLSSDQRFLPGPERRISLYDFVRSRRGPSLG